MFLNTWLAKPLVEIPLVAHPDESGPWPGWKRSKTEEARHQRYTMHHASTRCWPTDCARRGSKLSEANEVAWRRMWSGEWGKYLESRPESIVSKKKKKKEAAKLRSTSKIAKIRLFNFAEGLVPNSEKLYRVISCFCFHALPRIVHTGSCSFIIITGLNRHRCFPSDLRLRPFRKISCKLSQRFIRIVGLTGERSVAWEGLLINFQRHAIMECITCAQKRGLHGD